MKPLVLKLYFSGKAYKSVVRIGKLDTGETMKDIIVKNVTT